MDKTLIQSLFISSRVSLKQAMQKMNETAQKILFVVDDHERLIGTVTDGDIRRGIINGSSFGDSVENIMFRQYIALYEKTPNIREEAHRIMLGKKIEQIPVLNEAGMICDVLMWTDLLGKEANENPTQLLDNPVVIMAGGKGSRLDPFTRVLPKPLIPIGERPIIEHIMEGFHKYGFYKFVYTLNYKKEFIKLFLTETNYPYEVSWVEETDFLGTAGSLSLLQGKIHNSFFVINCDTILNNVSYSDILNWHREHGAAITVIASHNEYVIPFGVLEIANGKLKMVHEKPVHDLLINTGCYIMEPHILSYIPSGQRFDMNELINVVLPREKVSVYTISSGWLDVGQLDEYHKTLKHFQIAD